MSKEREDYKALLRSNIDARRTTLRNSIEIADMAEQSRLLRAEIADAAIDDEVRQLWKEEETIVRQEKALWLRLVLADYEF